MNIAQSLVDQINKTLAENKEKAKNMTPRWSKGDKVRVLKNLHVNIHNCLDYLGQICTIESVVLRVGFAREPFYEYKIKLGERIEPFFEDELDQRYKSNQTKS
jgi:hypothetical protein